MDPNAKDQDDLLRKYDVESNTRSLSGFWAKVFSLGCIAYSLFFFATSSFEPLETTKHRMLFVTGTVALLFLLYPARRGTASAGVGIVDAGLCLLSLAVGLFHFSQIDVIALAAGEYSPIHYYTGLVLLLLILEATRRAAGIELVIVSLIFVGYALFGQYMPGIFEHFGFSLERVTMHIVLTTEGILGLTTGIAATYVFLFILLGAFLDKGGMSDVFNHLSISLAGHRPGGPAKVAVIWSALSGMISGSAASNVVTSGAFTIPLMKRIGYRPAFAAAVEASSSTGGQIMPPVMGAGAFVMAEALNMPYADIMVAAALPACLFFIGIYFSVHLRAKADGLQGVDTRQTPRPMEIIRARWHLTIPLVLLIYMLVSDYSALYAASIAILVTIPVSWLRRETRLTPQLVVEALIEGARASLPVAIACVVVGFVVGVVSLTGIGTRLTYSVVSLADGHLSIGLALTMVVCIVLGMGLPTTAAYIVAGTVAAPILVELGTTPLSAHMFIFYFAIMAGITPPVAVSSFLAAGIARASATETSWISLRQALPGFIIPFMFVYAPVLLLQEGSVLEQVIAFVTAVIGVWFLTAATEGFINHSLSLIARVICGAAGLLLIMPMREAEMLGLAAGALVVFHDWHAARRSRRLQVSD